MDLLVNTDKMDSAPNICDFVPARRAKRGQISRANEVYLRLRDDIFELRLMPGDWLSEKEVADYFSVSRTPVREALQRLQGDGLMRGYVRGGWEVIPIDLNRFQQLYDFRKIIETHAVKTLCQRAGASTVLVELQAVWCVPLSQYLADGRTVATLDEAFHRALVDAANNTEITQTFDRLTDRLRVLRRLDFVYGDCIGSTYQEHAAILGFIAEGNARRAVRLINQHISGSQADVSKITLERLHCARTISGRSAPPYAPRLRSPDP